MHGDNDRSIVADSGAVRVRFLQISLYGCEPAATRMDGIAMLIDLPYGWVNEMRCLPGRVFFVSAPTYRLLLRFLFKVQARLAFKYCVQGLSYLLLLIASVILLILLRKGGNVQFSFWDFTSAYANKPSHPGHGTLMLMVLV
jgi:hypothetical protein